MVGVRPIVVGSDHVAVAIPTLVGAIETLTGIECGRLHRLFNHRNRVLGMTVAAYPHEPPVTFDKLIAHQLNR